MISDAYAAGLFDGEGSVIINHHKMAHNLACTMHLTDFPAISALHQRYGGSLNTVKRSSRPDGYRQIWGWRISGEAAAAFLRATLPHLIVKRDQAILGLQFQATKVNTRRMSADDKAADFAVRANYKRELQTLNGTVFA